MNRLVVPLLVVIVVLLGIVTVTLTGVAEPCPQVLVGTELVCESDFYQ